MFDENALISINKCIGFFSYILFGPLITKKKKNGKQVEVGGRKGGKERVRFSFRNESDLNKLK